MCSRRSIREIYSSDGSSPSVHELTSIHQIPESTGMRKRICSAGGRVTCGIPVSGPRGRPLVGAMERLCTGTNEVRDPKQLSTTPVTKLRRCPGGPPTVGHPARGRPPPYARPFLCRRIEVPRESRAASMAPWLALGAGGAITELAATWRVVALPALPLVP
jgi:hypothetical protein